MNRALWEKTWHEGKWLLLGSMALLVGFEWLRVWITSQFRIGQMQHLLRLVPDFIKGFFPVPPEVIASPAGRIAIGYDDPLVLVVVSIWAIARGSDAVSGEIGRGTMEMVLAQPVRRSEVLFTHGAVTVVGAALLAVAAWCGTWIGLQTIELEQLVSAKIFLPAALNLFALGVFLAGLTTMIGAGGRYRSRTIGIAVTVYAAAMIAKLVALSAPDWSWLRNYSFLTAFEPQKLAHAFWPETLARQADASWALLWSYNGLLVGLGLFAYFVAAVIFCRRDLPAPL